jgi:hypothetical protein
MSHVLIGFTDFPYDQGARPPLLRYHHVDSVSVSLLVQDLRAITTSISTIV